MTALPYALPSTLPGGLSLGLSLEPSTSPTGGAAGTLALLSPAHCASALSLLIAQYADSPLLQALLCSYLDRLHEAERGIVQVYQYGLDVDRAQGDLLDLLGRVVRESRDGRADHLYRNGIRVRILINRSQGRIPELLAIARLFEVESPDAPGDGSVVLREYQPARISVRVESAPQINASSEIHRRLRRAKAAGVALQTVTFPHPDATTARLFRLGRAIDTANTTTGLGWTGDTRGGYLGHALA